ncbi:MAG TPA: ABC transporter permease [Vicinamibacterales bacterium]|nr:ABC transporter permease [Vicinamibacterales bacterium]
MRDLKFALRQLLKNRGFTAVVVWTLALGIGANTAVFSLVNDVLLRTLPVKSPGELILFRNIDAQGGRLSRAGENNGSIDPRTGRSASTSFSQLQFQRFHDYHPALAAVFAYAPINRVNVLIDGQPETITLGQLVSGDYHAGLGVSAIVGRTLTPADDQPAAPAVAVISYRYWETRFGRDPGIVGKTIQVNRVPVTLIGVTRPGFAGAMQVVESVDITLALAQHTRVQADRAENRSQPWYWWIRVMGRLAPGVTAAQAAASLEPAFQQAAREGWIAGRSQDTNAGRDMPGLATLAADPGGQGEDDRRRQYAQSLRVLMALVGLVLLAACANVANLLLVRGAARRREIAVRLALGAGRARIVRQLLAECLLLALGGAMAGSLFAYWSRGLLAGLRQFGGAPAVLDLPLDARVLGFTIGVAAATALLFGLLPALRATRLDLAGEFQSGSRLLGDAGRSRLGQCLMIAQIAVSLVLLVSTGLFVHTLRNLQNVDPGFNPRRLVLLRIDAGSAGYTPQQFVGLHERLRQRLENIPGVQAATFSRVALLAGVRSNRRISVAGYTPAPGESMIFNLNGIAPNFLAAMEIPLVLGRNFDNRDDTDGAQVAIVNQAFSRKFFGDSSPIGRTLRFSGRNPTEGATDIEIVGVARDAKYTGVRGPTSPTMYVPAAQMLDGTASYYVRAAADPASVTPAIRAAVRELDPTLAIIDLHTQDEQIERLTSEERLFARLSGFFGVLALILASVGLYGLMSFVVLRRTGEIGLRMALGALPAHVLRMILRDALALVVLGLVLGVAAAFGGSRLIASMLFELSPVDPLTYGTVALVLVIVALLASFLPARRAAHVDPMTALRAE